MRRHGREPVRIRTNVCDVPGSARELLQQLQVTVGDERNIQVALLDDGNVAVTAELLGGPQSERLECIECAPKEVLDQVESWLEAHGGERIVVTVRGPCIAVATWRTRSTNLAMYWLATVLGKAWQPNFATRSVAPGFEVNAFVVDVSRRRESEVPMEKEDARVEVA